MCVTAQADLEMCRIRTVNNGWYAPIERTIARLWLAELGDILERSLTQDGSFSSDRPTSFGRRSEQSGLLQYAALF